MVDEIQAPLGYSDMPSHKAFAQKPPRVLYHYTDYNGARGIIESKSLWLTKLSYMNDRSELHLAIRLFREEADRAVRQTHDEEKCSYIASAAKQLESFHNTNICVGSFCEGPEVLSQWRAYGNDNKGVALEFNSESLRRLSNTGRMHLWKCVYNTVEQRAITQELVKNLLRSYDVIAQTRSTNTNWENAKKDLLEWFNTAFLQVAPVVKNEYFHEEKEWRLITVPMKSTSNDYFACISNDRVSQHHRLDFGLIDNGSYEFLEGVVVGPVDEQELVGDAFSVLLRQNGYKHKHVSYSQIPFRG